MSNRLAIAVLACAGLVAGAVPLVGVEQAGASPLAQSLLVATEVPPGWTAITPNQPFHGSCFQQAESALKKGWASTGFSDHKATVEEWVTGTSDRSPWQAIVANLTTCRHFRYHGTKATLAGTVQAAKLPTVGTASSSYSVAIVANKLFSLDDTVVLFQAHTKLGALVFISIGKPNTTAVTAFADAAASKAEGDPVPVAQSRSGTAPSS